MSRITGRVSTFHVVEQAFLSAKGLSENEVRGALVGFEPLGAELFPAEQARIVALLVERIDLSSTGIDLRMRIDARFATISEVPRPPARGRMTTQQNFVVGKSRRAILSKDGRTMSVHIPMMMRHKGGRKQVVTPADATPWISARHSYRQQLGQSSRPRPSLADMLESGRHATVRD